MTLRLAKTVTLAAVGFLTSLIALNNVVDYGSNFEFVRHVMSMDTTFPDNRLMGRAMPALWVHHSVYVLIIAVEATVALLCWWGACKMARARQDQLAFARARQIATAGYLLAILLWFVGFMGVGGEWFAMWQSQIWNGVDAAFRLTVIITLFLILLYVPDEWEARSGRTSDDELGRNESRH